MASGRPSLFHSIWNAVMGRKENEKGRKKESPPPRISKSPKWTAFVDGNYAENLPVLLKNLQNGQLSAAPFIFCVFVDRHMAIKESAARALHNTLSSLTFGEIVKLDRIMREKVSMEWSIDWSKYEIEDFLTPDMDEDSRRAVIILASFNPNGYVREKALRVMAAYEHTLPFIALRLNDWVGKVRAVAAAAFKGRLLHFSEGELLSALPYIEKAMRGNRNCEEDYAALTMEVLRSDLYAAELLNGLKSANHNKRRFCIRTMLASTPSDISLALAHLKKEPEPFLRALLFEKIVESGAQAREVATALLRDKFPRNRMLALAYLRSAKDEALWDATQSALLDKNIAVRFLAREIIGEIREGFDFRGFYINAMQEANAPGAILGLGETGREGDAELVMPYLDSALSSAVSAAMVTAMRLNPREYADTITRMLLDKRLRVVKTAQRLILKFHRADYPAIHTIFLQSTDEKAQRRCLYLLHKAPNKWERLLYMLDGAAAESEGVQSTAIIFLRHWEEHFNDSFVLPNATQKERIAEMLAANKTRLPSDTARFVEFSLKG